MDNLISVIIPVYNVEKYIERCLLSVTRQTHKKLEIICVNDCTPDNSMEIVQKFAQSDPRIKIVTREKNGGLSAARNSGFKAATGEYVYYIDSDDWIDEDYLEALLQKALQYKTDIVLNNNIKGEYEDGHWEEYHWPTYAKKIPQGEMLNREYTINNTPCMVWCHLYKRSFLVRHQLSFPEGYLNEDNYYNCITAIYTDKIFVFYGTAAYHYLQRDCSIMGELRKKGRALAYVKIVKLICDFFRKHPEFNQHKIKMVNAAHFAFIDSQEMFEISKSICEFIYENLPYEQHLYNGTELFYIQKIMGVKDFAELQKKYPKGLRMAFVAHCAAVRMRPKISVIVPVYNAEKYLDKTLSSIVHQTFRKIEIICINDQSTDRSLEILKKFAKEDLRIKIINNTQHLGVAFTRNAGLDIARGEYIYFIDADDSIDEDYLECMAKQAETANCDIILNISILTESNGIVSPFHYPSMPPIHPKGEYLDNLTVIHDAPCFIWARMYKKSFLAAHHLRFLDTYAEDVVFNAITTMYADRTFVFYGKNYHYTVTEESMTGRIHKRGTQDLEHIKAHSMIYDYLKEHNKLNNQLKLFRVYPFMKVDSQEKFDFYKQFFAKIEADFHQNENTSCNIGAL